MDVRRRFLPYVSENEGDHDDDGCVFVFVFIYFFVSLETLCLSFCFLFVCTIKQNTVLLHKGAFQGTEQYLKMLYNEAALMPI